MLVLPTDGESGAKTSLTGVLQKIKCGSFNRTSERTSTDSWPKAAHMVCAHVMLLVCVCVGGVFLTAQTGTHLLPPAHNQIQQFTHISPCCFLLWGMQACLVLKEMMALPSACSNSKSTHKKVIAEFGGKADASL